jgi:hypothetical protein
MSSFQASRIGSNGVHLNAHARPLFAALDRFREN